jgi:hypothetical protein
LIFQKNGAHITANSTKGQSAILLPLQYSNCYRLHGRTSKTTKIIRANLIHTLIIFTGNLDINLRWKFDWRHSECRKKDVEEVNYLLHKRM